jgi:hypothetical protein
LTLARKYRFLSDLSFLILLASVLILSAGGHLVAFDEETMFRVTQNLVSGKGLAIGNETLVIPAQSNPLFLPSKAERIPSTSTAIGKGGLSYSKYAIGQSLLAIPLYFAGYLWQGLFSSISAVELPVSASRLAVSMLNPIALALTGWLLVLFGRALGYSVRTARWVALACVFTSFAWPYVKTFYPQPGAAFLLLAITYSAYRWRTSWNSRWLWLLSCSLATMILVRLDTVIVLPALVLYLALGASPDRRWRWILPLATGLAIAGAATLAYNLLRFGSFTYTGYDEVAWNNPVVGGLYGFLFSPGKGVFVYAPLLILAVGAMVIFVKSHRAEAFLFTGLWLSFLIFYAPYNFWTGGFNWGPRFLLPVIPLGFLPLGSLLEESKSKLSVVVFSSLFILGLLVQVPAILVDHGRFLYQQVFESSDLERYGQTINRPDLSPALQQWPVALRLLRAYSSRSTWNAAERSLREIDQYASQLDIPNARELLRADFFRRNTPDFWWLHGALLASDYRPVMAIFPGVLFSIAGTAGMVFGNRRARPGSRPKGTA